MRSSVPTKIIFRVDWEAFKRGHTQGRETCEISGVGPVPVSVVKDAIDSGDPFIAAVVADAEQIMGVTHLGRRPNAYQLTALEWMQPECSVLGCRSVEFTEWDHRQDWAQTLRTPTDGLDRYCTHHHDLKTRSNWALVEGKGKRAMVPPHHPGHPSNKPPPEGQLKLRSKAS